MREAACFPAIHVLSRSLSAEHDDEEEEGRSSWKMQSSLKFSFSFRTLRTLLLKFSCANKQLKVAVRRTSSLFACLPSSPVSEGASHFSFFFKHMNRSDHPDEACLQKRTRLRSRNSNHKDVGSSHSV